MAKISLNKLNLEKNTEIKKVNIGGVEIDILQYLPIADKIDLLDIVIQESLIGYTCDPMLQDALLHMYITTSYTNITLTPTQKENFLDTYDLLEKNGVISEIVHAIPNNEYEELIESLSLKTEKIEKEINSVVGVIREAINKIPASLDEAKEQLSSIDFNSEALKNVIAIAKDNGAL